ncbi:DUF1641 domain-containing protein [Acidianus manzaensis]|nr:DUF1641 domain-containing protein [Acidianus manzaensis]
MSEVEIDEVLDLLKELKETGILDIINSMLRNREDIILEFAEWLKNNQNVMKNASLLLSVVNKINPDEVKKAKSLTEVILMLKDPDVLAGISYFLTIMKKLGESIKG